MAKSVSKSVTKTPQNKTKEVVKAKPKTAAKSEATPSVKRHRKPDMHPAAPERMVAHQATPDFIKTMSKHPALAMLQDEVAMEWRNKIAARRKENRKKRIIEDADELWQAVSDYLQFLDRTPFIASRPGFKGEPFHQAYRPPALTSGLCAFIGISSISWQAWKDPHNQRYREDLHDTINAIETMFHHSAAGQAATGELHANFVSGLLQIAKKHELGFGVDGGNEAEDIDNVLDKIRGVLDGKPASDLDEEGEEEEGSSE